MLPTKYRPNSFEDIVGNRETVASLSSLCGREDRPHTYLFHGPSGCGKTTLARIFAKEIGCAPQSIEEVNVSNNRGIDTARDIIERMRLSSLYGNLRIYILDEVHQTTKDFQNALLKALEEPPPHVYFILCTTNPEKLLPTIRNRCTTFSVSALSEKRLFSLLGKIARLEKYKVSEDVLRTIAKGCQGSPRAALVMLSQVGGLEEDAERVVGSLGFYAEEKQTILNLCRRLQKPKTKWKSIALILQQIEEDPETVRRAVLGYFNTVLLNTGDIRAALVIEVFEDPFYDSGRAGLTRACFQCCWMD